MYIAFVKFCQLLLPVLILAGSLLGVNRDLRYRYFNFPVRPGDHGNDNLA